MDQGKFPHTWHIEDADIIDALWHRESDGAHITRAPALAAELANMNKLYDEDAEKRPVHRELERRLLTLARAKKLVHGNGDYSLVDPVEHAIYSLRIRGEKPDEFYTLHDASSHRALQMAELLANLTGFRADYILATRLALIPPGETHTYTVGVTPIKFIITRS